MSAITLIIIGGWILLNGMVLYQGALFLRRQGQLAPEATQEDLARWVRGKGNVGSSHGDGQDDVPEALRPALQKLRYWRSWSRRYLVFVVIVLALMILFSMGQGTSATGTAMWSVVADWNVS